MTDDMEFVVPGLNNIAESVDKEEEKDNSFFTCFLNDRERDLNTPDIVDFSLKDADHPISDLIRSDEDGEVFFVNREKVVADTQDQSDTKLSEFKIEDKSAEETNQEVLLISDDDEDGYSGTTEIIKIPPVCDICNKWFTKKSSLKAHYQIHAGVKPYICEVCFKTFSKKSILDIHLLIHTGQRNFLCEICDKRFARKTDLRKHLLTHSDKKPYVCDKCNKSFNDKSNLKKHKLTHTKEKRFVCDICREAFTLKDVLLNHLKNHYLEESLLQNESSDKEKLQHRNYLKTMMRKHFHKCNECDKLFLRINRLKKHKLVHTSDYGMTHVCEVCNARFKSKDILQEHLLNHVVLTFNNDIFDPFDDISSSLNLESCDGFDLLDDISFENDFTIGEDPSLGFDIFDDITFPNSPLPDPEIQTPDDKTCDICLKKFTRKSSLNDHYLTHSGEKPHKCKMCEKRFSQKVTLKRHLLTHSGVRPFLCKICNKNFARKTSLQKHYISHSSKKLF